MLQISSWVTGDVLLRKTIACAGDQDSHVDDETTQGGDGGLETWENILCGPDVRGQVLWERVDGEVLCGFGAFERWIDVECAIGVVGALESVDLAILQGFFTERPAS